MTFLMLFKNGFACMIVTSIIFICTIAVAMDAWAMQTIVFTVQTTNDPAFTAGIIAVGGVAVGRDCRWRRRSG